MESPVIRWWIVFSVSAVGLITALFGGLGSFIAASDQTHLSWLILAIFFGSSIHWGYRVHATGAKTDQGAVTYFMHTCTSFGLLGTVVGLIMMITGAFLNLNTDDQESIKQALLALSSGIGTALVTTMMGLVCSILLRLQVIIVCERWRA